MSAAIPEGATVRIQKRRYYLPGDLVTVRRGDSALVTHRLLGYLPGPDGWRLITRADAAREADAPVPLSRLLGRVTHVDDAAFRPGLQDRAASLARWFPGIATWLVARHGPKRREPGAG